MQVRACCILSAVYTSERARLSAAVSAIVQAVRPFDLPGAICCIWSAGQAGHVRQGRFRLCPFCPRPSVRTLLFASLRLFKSRQGESREPESRKVESRQRVVSQSRQSRESREVKSRKSRKGRDIRAPTCAKVVKL